MNVQSVCSLLCALTLSSGVLLGNTWKSVVTCGFLNEEQYGLCHVDTVQLPSTVAQGFPAPWEYGPPVSVAITPDAAKALVVFQGFSNQEQQGYGSGVAFFDLTQPITAFINYLYLPSYYNPSASIAITPDGTMAVITDTDNNSVTLIDVEQMSVIDTISCGNSPVQAAITLNGALALVSNSGESKVSVVDLVHRTALSDISVDAPQRGIAVTPDGTKALAVMDEGVAVINLGSMTKTAVVTLSSGSKYIAVSPDGTLALVTGSSEITAIDLQALTVIGYPISIGSNLTSIAITPDGKQALVPNSSSPEPSFVSESLVYTFDLTLLSDLTSGSPIGISGFAVDEAPTWCAITPDQAPSAQFTYTSQGDKFFFDGSASTSPVGGIASYIWNFGDGASRTTYTPTVSHTYSGIGPFTVTLTVVNDGGTSLDTTFTGQTMSNNGGPSARIAQVVAGFGQPSKFFGKVHHSHHGQSVLHSWWHKKRDTKRYQIFSYNEKVASIRGSKKCKKRINLHSDSSYHSKKRRHHLHHKYKIRSVDAYGKASPFTALHVK